MNTRTPDRTNSLESTSTDAVATTDSTETPVVGSKLTRLALRLTAPAPVKRSLTSVIKKSLSASVASIAVLGVLATGQGLLQDLVMDKFETASSSSDMTPEARETMRSTTLVAHYECSTAGLDEGVVPKHALVRLADSKHGRVTLVSFARGWDIYSSEGRLGELAAVCAK